MKIQLQGFSGCRVHVEPAGSSYRLVKSTANPAYMPRLLRQAQKQASYSVMSLPAMFRVPHIYDTVQGDREVAIHMEYIRGLDIISYLSAASHEDINWLQQALCALVDYFCLQSPIVDVPSDTVHKKWEQTLQRIQDSPPHRAHMERLLDRTRRRFEQLPPVLSLPVGHCHGDLTLSNILIDPAGPRIVLIDFLDSFIETPLMDMVKLRQDTTHDWSCTIYGGHYPSVRLQSIMRHIDARLDAHFRRYDAYAACYPIFQLLNLLRILPYITEDHLIRTVCLSVEQELGH